MLAFAQLHAQDTLNALQKKIITEANAVKTGNWQDLLTNYFQVAAKNLAGKNKSLEFKGTIFGIKAKLDPLVNVDTNYSRHAFDRNFQFNGSLKLDTSYRFKKAGVGFTWAIINKRDSTTVSLIGGVEDMYFRDFAFELADALNAYRKEATVEEFNAAQQLASQMLATGKFTVSSFAPAFRQKLSQRVASNFNKVRSAFDSLLQATKKKPLLTLRLESLFEAGEGIFNGGEVELAYLQGLTRKGKPLELDLRTRFNVNDTMVLGRRYRNQFSVSGGMNCALITAGSSDKPVLEFKPYLEYNHVGRGLLPGEESNAFYANAELRVRVTKSLWIPVTLRYDIEQANFLGFLNVALNMNAFK